MNLYVALLSVALFASSCATNTQPVAKQNKATITVAKLTKKYAEPTMVNVVSVNRFPASEAGQKDISKQNDSVAVTSQVYKSPGEKIEHSLLLFTVKGHPEIAGQIMGNSGGSKLSAKFTQILGRMQKEGVTPKAALVISKAQVKFNELVNVAAEQRTEAIKSVLFETRDQLIAAY